MRKRTIVERIFAQPARASLKRHAVSISLFCKFSNFGRLSAALPVAMLTGAILFGTAGAPGCRRIEAPKEMTTDDPLPDAGEEEECALDTESVFSSVLNGTYEDTEMQSLIQMYDSLLCECFAGLNQSWIEGLTPIFETGTSAEINAAVVEMVECCAFDPDALDSDFENAKEQFLLGHYCSLPF
jgi:hypothetical protein